MANEQPWSFVLDPSTLTAIDSARAAINTDAVRNIQKTVNEALNPAVLKAIKDLQNSIVLPDIKLIDTSSLLPKMDFPAFNLAAIYPSIRLPRFIDEEFGKAFKLPALSDSMVELLKRLRESEAPNWPEGASAENMLVAMQDQGLPMVWVPSAEIIKEVLAVESREERLAVLAAHRGVLVDECAAVLAQVRHTSLAGQVTLATQALALMRDGHLEGAQALAVLVVDTAVTREFGLNHDSIRRKFRVDLDRVKLLELRLWAALCPLVLFYEHWHPKSGRPAPVALSRHVTVHQADPAHFTLDNALVATLLMTSVLRGLQEYEETRYYRL